MIQRLCIYIFLLSLGACATSSVKKPAIIKNNQKAQVHSKKVKHRELKRIDNKIAAFRKKDLLSKNNYFLPKPLNADTLYAEVIKSYRKNDQDGVRFYTENLLKRFPKNIHADNALFLQGKLSFRKGQIAQSLNYFQDIIKTYKSSNKRPSALLMKARAYAELNLKELAIEALQQLRKEYPGSPESYQADAELSLLTKI